MLNALILEVPHGTSLQTTDKKYFRAVNVMALIGALNYAVWAAATAVGEQQAGQGWTALVSVLLALGFASVIAVNRAGFHVGAAVALHVLFHVQSVGVLVLFGFAANAYLYYFAFTVAPYLSFGRANRALAHGFAALSIVALVAAFFLRDNLEPVIAYFPLEIQQATNLVLAVLSLAAIAVAFLRFIDRTEDALIAEQARSQALLLNVLPETIAERLKNNPNDVIADRYESVSVLFADIVGFTRLSTETSPAETVKLLNTIFSEFDEICDRHGVEKIRTIRDGYMAIAGAPLERDDHSIALARAAIEMRDYMAEAALPHEVHVRIGINCGAVVAGIVGRRRFHYDVWSDAVNVAARMESTGEPGRIQITDDFKALIRDVFPCTPRAPIEVKGKGIMRTWFLA